MNSGGLPSFLKPGISSSSTSAGSFHQFGPPVPIAQLEELPSYQDDEPIEVREVRPEPQEDVHPKLELSARCGIVPVKVSQTTAQEVPCMISLKGQNRTMEAIERMRPGTDIVCVIDVSGSMTGAKISLVKETLKFLIENAVSHDRVSLVTFDDRVDRLCPLTVCTPSGKATLSSLSSQIVARGGTNIALGLRSGLKVLQDRRTVNTVSSLFLLSDGVDTCGPNPAGRCGTVLDAGMAEIQGGLILHTFGFGADNDSQVMSNLAERGRGAFQFVERLETVAVAFALRLGGDISQVAKDIEVHLNLNPGPIPCTIARLYARDDKGYFTVPNVTANESKDLVFILTVPSFPLPKAIRHNPVSAQVQYSSLSGQQLTELVQLEVDFVPEDNASKPEISADVYLNWYRVKTAEVLSNAKKCAEQSRFAEAQSLLQAGIVELQQSVVWGNPQVAQLIADLETSMQRSVNQQSYNSGGAALLSSLSSSHLTQTITVNSLSYASPQTMDYAARTMRCQTIVPDLPAPYVPAFHSMRPGERQLTGLMCQRCYCDFSQSQSSPVHCTARHILCPSCSYWSCRFKQCPLDFCGYQFTSEELSLMEAAPLAVCVVCQESKIYAEILELECQCLICWTCAITYANLSGNFTSCGRDGLPFTNKVSLRLFAKLQDTQNVPCFRCGRSQCDVVFRCGDQVHLNCLRLYTIECISGSALLRINCTCGLELYPAVVFPFLSKEKAALLKSSHPDTYPVKCPRCPDALAVQVPWDMDKPKCFDCQKCSIAYCVLCVTVWDDSHSNGVCPIALAYSQIRDMERRKVCPVQCPYCKTPSPKDTLNYPQTCGACGSPFCPDCAARFDVIALHGDSYHRKDCQRLGAMMDKGFKESCSMCKMIGGEGCEPPLRLCRRGQFKPIES